MTRSHHEPRGQSLEIPFPGAECDFIEVVQVKYELAFRRRESAKRHQMRVAAYGHDQAGIRYLAQVVRLQDRAAPEERKRRLHHPCISERDQSCNASPAVLLQQFDRVAVYRSDLGVRGPSHLLAVRLACGHTRRRLVFSRHPTLPYVLPQTCNGHATWRKIRLSAPRIPCRPTAGVDVLSPAVTPRWRGGLRRAERCWLPPRT